MVTARLRVVIAVAWLLSALLGGCQSAGAVSPSPLVSIGPRATATDGAAQGVTLEEAISSARTHMPADAELWSYAPGVPSDVMQKIFGPGSIDEPPHGATRETLVWAVAFKVGDGLTTVYLDLLTGAWLESRDTPGPAPAKHRSDIAFMAPILHVSNGTTLTVNVYVNDQLAGTFTPETWAGETVNLPGYGASPWRLDITTEAGRSLLALEVKPEDNFSTSGDYPHSAHWSATRVDLSCGRLEVYVAGPMGGPGPPESFPAHDCEP